MKTFQMPVHILNAQGKTAKTLIVEIQAEKHSEAVAILSQGTFERGADADAPYSFDVKDVTEKINKGK